jgi:MFS family permease
MSRYQWVLIGLLTGFWGLVGINRLGIGYILPAIVKPFHMTQLQAGLLISGTSFTWAFSSWASGWLSDRYGRKRVLIPGAVFACAATAAMGAAWNWLSLFVIRDLIGLGDGVGWPSGQSTLAEEVPAERRALVSGIFTAGYPLFGSVIGAVVITSLVAGLGWRRVFPILAAVGRASGNDGRGELRGRHHGTFALPAIAGLVADGFGMQTGFAVAALCALLAGLLAIAIPETAPRVLARRRTAPVVASA